MAGGVLGTSLFLYEQNKTKKKVITNDEYYKKKLLFEPWYFSVDKECADLFIELQEFRHCSFELYDDAGNAVDLFCLLLKKYYKDKDVKLNQKYIEDLTNQYRESINKLNVFKKTCLEILVNKPVINHKKYAELSDAETDTEAKPNIRKKVYDKECEILEEKHAAGEVIICKIGELIDDIIKCLEIHVRNFQKKWRIEKMKARKQNDSLRPKKIIGQQ